MRESSIERGLRIRLQRRGCLVYKFVSPGNNGVPDRIVITPTGRVIFVELKTSDGKLRPEQEVQLRRLRGHKAEVAVLYGREDVLAFTRKIEEAGS